AGGWVWAGPSSCPQQLRWHGPPGRVRTTAPWLSGWLRAAACDSGQTGPPHHDQPAAHPTAQDPGWGKAEAKVRLSLGQAATAGLPVTTCLPVTDCCLGRCHNRHADSPLCLPGRAYSGYRVRSEERSSNPGVGLQPLARAVWGWTNKTNDRPGARGTRAACASGRLLPLLFDVDAALCWSRALAGMESVRRPLRGTRALERGMAGATDASLAPPGAEAPATAGRGPARVKSAGHSTTPGRLNAREQRIQAAKLARMLKASQAVINALEMKRVAQSRKNHAPGARPGHPAPPVSGQPPNEAPDGSSVPAAPLPPTPSSPLQHQSSAVGEGAMPLAPADLEPSPPLASPCPLPPSVVAPAVPQACVKEWGAYVARGSRSYGLRQLLMRVRRTRLRRPLPGGTNTRPNLQGRDRQLWGSSGAAGFAAVAAAPPH
ncbi:hypothetical protein HaLaN_25707, partial [Haematococcus lacustris]